MIKNAKSTEKRKLPPRETICFFIDLNTGSVKVESNRFVFIPGLYICLSVYSKEAAILLNKLKLKSCEVEQFTKIRQDERMA